MATSKQMAQKLKVYAEGKETPADEKAEIASGKLDADDKKKKQMAMMQRAMKK